MDIAAFRTEFPEFASTVNYPDAQITFYASIAEMMVIQSRWENMYTYGVKLYVAHELVLARANLQASQASGLPGQFAGIANNKSVGNASVGYDSNNTSEKNAGWWNLTIYGKQFYRLLMMFGAGAVQI